MKASTHEGPSAYKSLSFRRRFQPTGRFETRDVMVALVGNGELESPLRAPVAELQLQNQVMFCGRRPHTEIADWISACDVLCLPSFREGCRNVVLEALPSGRPVVASNVGGVPELLRPGTGLLAPAGEPRALAEALRRALRETWDPDSLRAFVECLSRDQFGLALKNTLVCAMEECKG
jgi:glycosyltransferase involved in cell wall biosynthesis